MNELRKLGYLIVNIYYMWTHLETQHEHASDQKDNGNAKHIGPRFVGRCIAA